MLKTIIYIFIIAGCFLFSCSSEKKATRQLNKIAVAFPEKIAQKANLLFPFKPTTDTLKIITSDSTAYKESIELLQSQIRISNIIIDSIVNSIQSGDTECIIYRAIISDLQKQNNNLVYSLKNIQPVHDIKTITLPAIEDTKRIFLCEHDKSIAIELLAKKTTEADNWKATAKQRFWIMWALIVAIAIVVVYKIYKSTKK